HYQREAFVGWLEGLRRDGKTVFNPPEMVLWNLDKRYLFELAGKGVHVPRMRVVPNDLAAITAVYDEFGWEQAVIKPTVGASGHEVEGARGVALAGAGGRGRSPVIVQELLPELSQTGELSCVFFGGEFSHAFVKQPTAGEFRINSQYGGVIEAARPATAIV